MKKVMTVYGTRPEGIKMAPVIRRLEEDPRFECISVVTGQHREMLDQVNEVLGITPTHDLDVFAPGQTLNEIMARIITLLDPILEVKRPDAVVVQGDTSTVAAAALATALLRAGARTRHATTPDRLPGECAPGPARTPRTRAQGLRDQRSSTPDGHYASRASRMVTVPVGWGYDADH